MHCTAFLGMSLDGFIAGVDGDLAWLDEIPAPADNDMGFGALMDSVDAVVMGSSSFAVVAGFEGPWPYSKPLVVMSSSLSKLPDHVVETELTASSPRGVVSMLAERGWDRLYIDGGAVVRSFHEEGLLDELIVTVLPVVLGDGVKLMSGLVEPAWLQHVSTEVFANGFVQTRYAIGTNASPS